MAGPSISVGSRYFKWYEETRLLLIAAVTKVDEEQKFRLHSVENIITRSHSGTSAAAAANPTPFRTNDERWQKIASRMPAVHFQMIDDLSRIASTCHSQFMKLQQRLKLLKPDRHDHYRRGDGERDPIMTDEICRKIKAYLATFCKRRLEKANDEQEVLRRNDTQTLRGERRSKLTFNRDGHKREGAFVSHGRGLGTVGRRKPLRKLARGRPPLQKRHAAYVSESTDDRQPRKRARGRPRLQKHDEVQVSESADDKQPRKPARGRPRLQKRHEAHVSESNDNEPLRNLACGRPPVQKPHEGYVLESDDAKQPHSDHPQKVLSGSLPPQNDDHSEGENSPVSEPLSNEQQLCKTQPEESNEQQLCTTQPEEVAASQELAKGDTPLQKNSGEQHVSVSDNRQLCTVGPLPAAERAGALATVPAGKNLEEQNQEQSGRKSPETRLCTALNFPRASVFRWTEAARLQVIQSVKMVENNPTEPGQIRSWRDVAAGLPMKLFWDLDVDRLATIAKKQFSELRRRYKIVKDNEIFGDRRVIRFSTLTKQIMQELDNYEEGNFQSTPETLKLCGSTHDRRLWITQTPIDANNGTLSSARGAVIVELLTSSDSSMGTDSSRSRHLEFGPLANARGANEKSVVPRSYFKSSDYHSRRRFETRSRSDESETSERQYVRHKERNTPNWKAAITGRKAAAASFSFSRSFFGSEEIANLRRRQAASSSEDHDRCSEPQEDDSEGDHIVQDGLHGGSWSPVRQEDEFSNWTNQQNGRLSDRQKRGMSFTNDGPGSHEDSQSPTESLWDESSEGARQEESLSAGSGSGSDRPESDSIVPNHEGSQRRLGHGKSSVNSDSGPERFQNESDHHLDEEDLPLSADERDSHSYNNLESGSSERGDNGSESVHSQKDRAESDSVSADGDHSESEGDSDAVAHDQWNNNNSGSEDFVQSDSEEDFQNGNESVHWKSASSPDSQCAEGNGGGRQIPPSNLHHSDHHQDRPPKRRPRANGGFEHCEKNPLRSTQVTDSSAPEPDEMSREPSDKLPSDKLLSAMDVEFSRLNWWVKHRLFPMEREKIASAIVSSATIPNTLDKSHGAEEGYDEVISQCRLKRIRWVLKAELQQVRLKLVEEIDKCSQNVIQEILQSFSK